MVDGGGAGAVLFMDHPERLRLGAAAVLATGAGDESAPG